jgi:hypothetical protein
MNERSELHITSSFHVGLVFHALGVYASSIESSVKERLIQKRNGIRIFKKVNPVLPHHIV